VPALLARLEKWLAQHRPRYLYGLEPGATAQELNTLEAALGGSVPADLRALLAWHDGQKDDFIGCLEQSWNLMSAQQIAAARQELQAAGDGPASKLIPFLDNDAGDFLCLDTGQPDAPVRAVWRGKAERPVVARSLAAWLEEFVAAVERGEYHEDPERGYFFRQRPEG
jgi:cell wall assembly regulator SMI1